MVRVLCCCGMLPSCVKVSSGVFRSLAFFFTTSCQGPMGPLMMANARVDSSMELAPTHGPLDGCTADRGRMESNMALER